MSVRRDELSAGVSRLSLAAPPHNLIGSDMLSALDERISQLEQAPPRVLLLDGVPSPAFCRGFDPAYFLGGSRSMARQFLHRWADVLARFVALPSCTLAVISGDAIGAGFVLGLACDFRVVGLGEVSLGLDQVTHGAALMGDEMLLLSHHTNPSVATRLATFGSLLDAEQSLEVGYADVVSEDPINEALGMAETLAGSPGRGAIATKLVAALPLAAEMRARHAVAFDAVVDAWTSPAAKGQLSRRASEL